MAATLEKLFSPTQRQRLSEAIPARYSCRAFRGAPSTADWAALCYTVGRYALPDTRLHLMTVSESLFTGTLLNMGRVSGCTTVAAVIAKAGEEQGRIHAGILGETLCLEAVAMGLGCCWISGTYRKKQLTVSLKEGEAVLSIIALGVPEKPNEPAAPHRRKSLERLCKGNVTLWPETYRRVAEAVRIAPSAINLQPWSMTLDPDRFVVDGSDRARLDLGIALTHAELMLDMPHVWHFGTGRRGPAAWAQLR